MTVNNGIRVLAGSMVLLSVVLREFAHPYWVGLTIFIGLNLIQSAFTGFCPPEKLLRMLGLDDEGKSCCGK